MPKHSEASARKPSCAAASGRRFRSSDAADRPRQGRPDAHARQGSGTEPKERREPQRPGTARRGEGGKEGALQGAGRGVVRGAASPSAQDHRQRASRKKGQQGPSLRIIPLGGLDGIGKNMTAYECEGDIVVVDAGLMFPDDDHLGIDLILPDYTYLLENAHKIRAILITHGHEDHTGALPYLLKDLGRNIPVYGSKMTLGLISGKFAEHKVSTKTLTEANPRQTLKLGCFEATFFTVNHSIPGAYGIFLKTPAGTVLYTGDFKLDQTPIDGVHTDYEFIAKCGARGVDLMLSDSTNAKKRDFTRSEAEVGEVLGRIISTAKRKVIVASFASQIHRIQQVCNAAKAAGRKVAVTGRSMLTNTQIARDLGYLEVDDDLLVDSYEIKDIPPNKLVVLCTGSQGEPLSALARMSSGEHRTIQIEGGDTVIISATPVPGNEKAVTRVINSLSKIGALIYDKNNCMVHVSGHAASEELKIMITMVHPRYFMPVHGEAAHLQAHAELARKVGVKDSHVFILDNGDSLLMHDHKVGIGDSVESGVIYVDGLSVGDTNQVVLRDRQVLANDGIATVVVMLDRKTHKLAGDIELIMRGVSGGEEKTLLEDARRSVREAVEESRRPGGHAVQREVRDALSKLIWDRCRRRPMVLPIIMDV